MPKVTIKFKNTSIVVSAHKDRNTVRSVDLTAWDEHQWNLDRVSQALNELEQQAGNPKDVHCKAGINRSPALAALWLWAKNEKSTIEEVFNAVKDAYEEAGVKLSKLCEASIANVLNQALGKAAYEVASWSDVKGETYASLRAQLAWW